MTGGSVIRTILMPTQDFCAAAYCAMLRESTITFPATEEAWMKPVLPSRTVTIPTWDMSNPAIEVTKQTMSPVLMDFSTAVIDAIGI